MKPALVTIALLLPAAAATAGTLDLSHSGRLTDASGAPVSGPTNLEIDLVDVATSAVLNT